MTSKSEGRSRPYAKFVKSYMDGYMAGETASQIAKRCETTRGGMFVHAAALRKKGVKLPKLNDRFDARILNGIIRKAREAVSQ
jgi:hypothetical protein